MRRVPFLLSVLLFVLWGPQVLAQSVGGVKKIRLDPEAAEGGAVGQYVDSVCFIPLESSKESQVHSIFQLETGKDAFVILDKDNSTVFIFSRAGKFRGKIKVGGNVYQVTLDKNTNLIEVDEYPDAFFYDLNGKLAKKASIASRPNTQIGVSRAALDGEHTAYYNTNLKVAKDSLIYQVLVYRRNVLTHHFLPYPVGYKMDVFDNVGPINFSSNVNDADTGIYYMRNYDFTVYRLTPSSITPVYQFVFPLQNSIPPDFMTDSAYNGKRFAFLSKPGTHRLMYRLFAFYKRGEQLFFSCDGYSYILDTRTQRFVCVNKVLSDSTSHFLPLTDSELDIRRRSMYLNFDGDHFYFSCSPEVLFDQRETMRDKRPRYPPEMEAFFSDKKNETTGNPVLIQVKFKDTF